jgi:chromosome segregation ATPase
MNGNQRSSPTRQRSSGNGQARARRQASREKGAVTAAQFQRLSERMEQVEGELDHLRRAWDRMGTSPQGVHEQIEKNGADLSVQFQRIAMMQAEIDRLKASEAALRAEIERLMSSPGADLADRTTPQV